jgi:hypothetical protein
MNKFIFSSGFLALSIAATSFASSPEERMNVDGNSVRSTNNKSTSKARKNGFIPIAAKKGGSGVALAYRIDGTPVVGSPLTIRIEIKSSADAQVTLKAEDGLLLSAPDHALGSQAGLRTEHAVTVVPQAEGRFYLNVFSSANGRSSASAIAVQVGKNVPQLKPAGQVQVTSTGERIISVPTK